MPNPLRLNEFVAMGERLFEKKAFETKFEWQAFYDVMGLLGDYRDRPQDRIFC